MRPAASLICAALATLPTGASSERLAPRSPIYGVAIPKGYRDWGVIAPATEDAPLDELRVVLGDRAAVEASRSGRRMFPDGATLVKLAWRRTPSRDFATATVPGPATTVQVMVKDQRQYQSTGGWGFGRFIDGRPVDEAQHRACFACHDQKVRDRDWVFTRYAP